MLVNNISWFESTPAICNIGLADRIFRAALAVVLIGQMLFVSGIVSWQPYLVFVGIYLAMTVITAWDPIYQMLHLETNIMVSSGRHGGVNNVTADDALSSQKHVQPNRVDSEHEINIHHDQAA